MFFVIFFKGTCQNMYRVSADIKLLFFDAIHDPYKYKLSVCNLYIYIYIYDVHTHTHTHMKYAI